MLECNEDSILKIPVNTPVLSGNEKKYLLECIDTGWISSDGPFVKKFEKLFSLKCNRSHGIAVSSGTAALDIAIQALGISPGDEVIMPSFTIISCASAVVRAGAKVVLVDSDPKTWNMDTTQIEAKITSKTKAIMVVHTYGLPVDMEPVTFLAKQYNLKIIEDAAEAIGQTYNKKTCGSFGDISIMSFYPNKHVTTGEGGMILTDDPHLADRCKSIRNLCFTSGRRFVHYEIGFNYRMTNMQAALGVAQLEQLEKHLIKKRLIGHLYNESFSELFEGVTLPVQTTAYADNCYWVYGLVLSECTDEVVEKVMQKLAQNGVGVRPFFWPMHEQPVLRKMGWFKNEKYPVAENLARKGFYIPSGLALTEREITYVSKKVKEVLNECI